MSLRIKDSTKVLVDRAKYRVPHLFIRHSLFSFSFKRSQLLEILLLLYNKHHTYMKGKLCNIYHNIYMFGLSKKNPSKKPLLWGPFLYQNRVYFTNNWNHIISLNICSFRYGWYFVASNLFNFYFISTGCLEHKLSQDYFETFIFYSIYYFTLIIFLFIYYRVYYFLLKLT